MTLLVILLIVVFAVGVWLTFDRKRATIYSDNSNRAVASQNGSAISNSFESANSNINSVTINRNLEKKNEKWRAAALSSSLLPTVDDGESIRKVRCNDQYCLVAVASGERVTKLFRLDKDNAIVDLSQNIPILLSKAVSPTFDFQWNGQYWYINNLDSLISYDGKEFSITDWRTYSYSIQAFHWNGNGWGVVEAGPSNNYAMREIANHKPSGPFAFIKNNGKQLTTNAVSWTGSGWILFGEATNSDGLRSDRMPFIRTVSILPDSDPSKRYVTVENDQSSLLLKGYTHYHIEDVLQINNQWYVTMRNLKSNIVGLFVLDDNGLRENSEILSNKGRESVTALGGDAALFAISQLSSNVGNDVTIVNQGSRDKIFVDSKYPASTLDKFGDGFIVATTKELWKVTPVSQ